MNKKKIITINGFLLHRAIVAGIRKIVAHQDYLNKINVFPVPDGDTGTNMAFTMNAILDGTENHVHTRVDDMLEAVADSALDGARGNSGAILAQFFQGLSDGSVGLETMNAKQLAIAFGKGSEYARDALSEPKEGTILTVINDFADKLEELTTNGEIDIEHILGVALITAKESLKNTPNLMAVLKKAGVVDAGAQGFVDFIVGMYEFIKDGTIEEETLQIKDQNISDDNHKNDGNTLAYRFCTECMVIDETESIDRNEIKEALLEAGDSMVVAGSRKRAKIHIHTNDPASIFSICEQFGNVTGQKADDMVHQQHDAHGAKTNDVAIITDSGADFNEDDLDIHVVPVRYSFGDKGYIDKVSQTTSEFFNELFTNPIHPQTSQPVPGDFRRQYQFLSSHYKSIISIHIPHKLSGTLQSAKTAIKRTPEANVTVLDSYNISVGLGLIVKRAAEMVKAEKSHEQIIKEVNRISKKTSIYASVEDLSYSVKGGRVPKIVMRISDFLRFKPILSTGSDGSMKPKGVIFGSKNRAKKLANFVMNRHRTGRTYRFSIGHANCIEQAEELKKIIEENYKKIDSIDLLEIGSALGVHTGPGALLVGIQEHRKIR